MVTLDTLVIRKHAAQEMNADHISVGDALAVINEGDVINVYADDRPYPSRLMLLVLANRPIHVVSATDVASGLTYLVTAYVANPDLWDADFKTRRRR